MNELPQRKTLTAKGVGVRFAGDGVLRSIMPERLKNYPYKGVKGVDLEVGQGDIVAVVGDSGSGKSALLRALSTGYKDTQNAKIDGSFFVDGEPVKQGSLKNGSHVVGAFHPQWHTPADSMLDDVRRFAQASNDPNYSGNDPLAVVLDEPTLNLDTYQIEQLGEGIKRISEKSGVVMVVHDLGFALEHANHVVHLQHGEVAFNGDVGLLMGRRSAASKETYDFLDKRLIMQGRPTLSKWGRSEDGAVSISGVEIKKVPASVAKAVPTALSDDVKNAVVSVRELGVVFDAANPQKRFQALSDVSFDVPKGLTYAFIGPSGSGKTTALKAINLMHPSSAKVTGGVKFKGEDIFNPDVDPVKVRSRFGYVAQKATPYPGRTMVDDIGWAATVHGLVSGRDAKVDLAERVLEKVGLTEDLVKTGRYLRESGTSLSGGQEQRFCIARALAIEPEMLLMDEPCSALDPIATAEIEELIGSFQRAGMSSIVVTHSMEQAFRLSQKIAYFHSGSLLEAGDSGLIATNPTHPSTLDFISGRIG